MSHLVRAELLHCVHVLDREVDACDLRAQPGLCVVEVDIRPLAHELRAAVALGMHVRVRACLGRREGVVEAVVLDRDELLVLAVERVAEEAEREVERGGEHAVLGLSAEDGEGVGCGEVLEEEAVPQARGDAEVVWGGVRMGDGAWTVPLTELLAAERSEDLLSELVGPTEGQEIVPPR